MSPSPLRVLAVIEAATLSGPAKNLLRFCRRVREGSSGPTIEMTLATFYRGEPSTARTPFLDAAASYGIPVDIIPERHRFDFGVIDRFRDLLARRRPHILQTHAVKTNFLVRAGGLNRGLRWLAFHHGYTAEDWRVALYNRLNPWSLRRADRVVTVCNLFRDQLVEAGIRASGISVLPNAIEDFIPPSPTALAGLRATLATPEEPLIVNIGRHSHEKGQIHLLRAAALLAARKPGLRFHVVLVGDGPDRAALESFAAASPLAGRIHFTGHQLDVRPYLAIADLFALPSLSEGSPNVILEAMAAAVPIVATSVGGVPEAVIHSESALLCPPADEIAFAAAIEQILSLAPEAAALANSLRKHATARLNLFTPAAYEATLRAIYAGLNAVQG